MSDAADRRTAAELAGEMRWFAAASAGVPAALRRALLELAAELERLAAAPHCGNPILSSEAERDLNYARREAPRRGGYIWEGARTAYEAGEYLDPNIVELLEAGLLVPHADPTKGWVPVQGL